MELILLETSAETANGRAVNKSNGPLIESVSFTGLLMSCYQLALG